MTSSLGGFPEIHTSCREAPASMSSLTRLDPVARLAGLLAAADGGEGQRGGVEPGVAGVDVGPGVEQQPDHRGVPVVGGGVQGLLAESCGRGGRSRGRA